MSQNVLADRMSRTHLSATVGLTKRAEDIKARGGDIILLTVGEPDFATPRVINEAGKAAIDAGQTKYSPLGGVAELKRAIQRKFLRENNLSIEERSITVGAGAKNLIFSAMLATLNQDDEVVISVPYWVSYVDITRFCGGSPTLLDTEARDGFKLRPHLLREVITSRTKWVILNSPSNPTGACYSEDELLALAKVLIDYPHVNILCDDIYEHIQYHGRKDRHLAELCPALQHRILIINGLSKAYAMTGWRIGYAAGDAEVIRAIDVIQSQNITAPATMCQIAAASALDMEKSFREEWLVQYRERRDLLVEAMRAANGLDCAEPEGAFYCFISCNELIGKTMPTGKTIQDDVDFADQLLVDKGVAVVPGSAFGKPGYFRVSYALELERLKRACARIDSFARSLI